MVVFSVINNSEPHVDIDSTVKKFIAASPRGAYTTMKIKEEYLLVDWDMHVERLIKSIAAIHTALDHYFAAYYNTIRQSVCNSRAHVPSILPR